MGTTMELSSASRIYYSSPMHSPSPPKTVHEEMQGSAILHEDATPECVSEPPSDQEDYDYDESVSEICTSESDSEDVKQKAEEQDEELLQLIAYNRLLLLTLGYRLLVCGGDG